MTEARITDIRDFVNNAFRQQIPDRRNDAWLASIVNPPRYNWDWEALEKGFFEPFRDWSERNSMRLRPILAALLIDALGGDYRRHADVLATLEMHYLASIMLDDLRNGRNLSESTTSVVELPLPVWVTIAYNARQLAPVLIFRRAESLGQTQRRWLARRFAHFLFRQGLGNTLDLWGSEQEIRHANIKDFITHLHLYAGPLTFSLACDVASAAAGLDRAASERLARAGCELGVAVRMAELARNRTSTITANCAEEREQRVRWTGGIDEQVLTAASETVLAGAMAAADVRPAVVSAFRTFTDMFEISKAKEIC